jgi:hypothetical protein
MVSIGARDALQRKDVCHDKKEGKCILATLEEMHAEPDAQSARKKSGRNLAYVSYGATQNGFYSARLLRGNF